MITRAVILCPGPSLSGFLAEPRERDGSTVVIGVNRAAEAFACDWWTAADHESIGGMNPVGSPRLCTPQQAIVLAHGKWPDSARVQRLIHPSNVRSFERLGQETDCPLKNGWKTLSMLAALVLAENLMQKGAEGSDLRIDIYGADWAGTLDWDGYAGPGVEVGRSAYRWKNERTHYDRMEAWLKAKGVIVTRHTAEGGSP